VGARGVALLELLSIDWIVKSMFSYQKSVRARDERTE